MLGEVASRFEEVLRQKRRISLRISNLISKRGGIKRYARDAAHGLLTAAYDATFTSSHNIAFGEPFITSFCSHVADQAYERDHGLLSQWRGYGGAGGFCIVFNTERLCHLLEMEQLTHYWVHLNIAPVHYASGDIAIQDIFPVLLDYCQQYLSFVIDRKNAPLPPVDGLPLFINATTLFKHQGFREEREVRVVAIPGPLELRKRMQAEFKSFVSLPIKKILSRESERGQCRYLSLFEGLNADLPIERVIIGPSPEQNKNFDLARDLLGNDIPVARSATPFIG